MTEREGSFFCGKSLHVIHKHADTSLLINDTFEQLSVSVIN